MTDAIPVGAPVQPWWLTLRRPAPVLLRWGLGVVAAFLGLATGTFTEMVPWLLLVLLLDTCATYVLDGGRAHVRVAHFPALVLLAMAAASAAGAFQAGPGALPLMLIPAFQAGARLGSTGATAVVAVELLTALTVGLAGGRTDLSALASVVQAVAIALVIGLVAAWATALRRLEPEESLLLEAGDLLRRLRTVADGLDTGFDGPASAERALAALADAVPCERAAVLVTYNDVHTTPLALRGVHRVPWPDPADPEDWLHPAWESPVAMTTTWADGGTERALAAVRLTGDSGNRVGMIVLDRSGPAFSEDEVEDVETVASRHARAIEVALVFESLRARSALEERTRLSRVMHDGVAQELAALGYHVDALRAQARREGSDLTAGLDGLRTSLSSAMTDIRLRIADLRVGDHLDARLGAVISNRLQTFGAWTGISTTIQLAESGLRLPAHVEVMLYRLVLDVLEDARRAGGTTSVEVAISVTAPEAEVVVAHDGASTLGRAAYDDHPLVAVGATVDTTARADGGVVVRAHLPARSLSRETGPELVA